MNYCKHVWLVLFITTFCDVSAHFSHSSLSKTVAATLTEIDSVIATHGYYAFNKEKSAHKALDAYVQELDEYSHYLTPHEYNELLQTTRGNYHGIGVTLAPKKRNQEAITVLSVLKDSPASRAGIKAHDKIIAINNTPLKGRSITDCVNTIKAHDSTHFSIKRLNGVVQHHTLKPSLIKDELCDYVLLENNTILYCKVPLFTYSTADELHIIFNKTLSTKLLQLKGIILDLRDNPGGVLQGAVDCAGLFLKKNSLIAYTKNRLNQKVHVFKTNRSPYRTLIDSNIPIIVLVNENTISAAEICAAALRYYSRKALPQLKRASPYIYIVGTITHGKGSVQELRPLTNGAALQLTTALYYLPDGSSIHNKGLTPDFILKQLNISKQKKKNNIKDGTRAKDCALEHAVSLITVLTNSIQQDSSVLHDQAIKLLKASSYSLG